MSSSGELRVLSPGDLDAPARVYPWSRSTAESAVAKARNAAPQWAATPLPARLELLKALRARFVAHKDAFARLLGVEVGKPLWEGAQEAQLLANKIDSTLDEGLKLVAPHQPAGVDGEWRYRPHGVLVVIGPFNFPVHLPNGHIVPALAMGNTVLFKPSELTPAVGALYGQCVAEAGFPDGVFQIVQGERSIGEYLSQDAEVDGVLFTGSVAVGNAIARANVDRPGKLLALELGGKNAALVFEDADLDRAAYQVAYGAYITAGQRCSSTSRVRVQRSAVDRVQAKLTAIAKNAVVGHFENAGAFLGPLVSEAAKAKFIAAVAAADATAIVRSGEATVAGKRGHYLRPSLHRVERLSPGSPYQTQELFGPDLAIYVFSDEAEGLALANDTEFGLCASVFTGDRARFDRLADGLRAGVINWNSPTVGASGKLPFGGVGNSGNHRPAGIFSALYCSWPAALSYGLSGPSPAAPAPGLSAT